jgi:DNA primase
LLERVAPLHEHGFANALLILEQRPDATHLGDYRSWSTVGRQVPEGAVSVRVLARRPAAGARPRTEHVRYLFDITQTIGRGRVVPPAAPLPPGRVPAGLWEALRRQVHRAGFRIDRLTAGERDERSSRVDWQQRVIRLAPELGEADTVQALAHELAHLQMHTADQLAGGCADMVALQADSVACLITRAAGMTPTGYQFPATAAWPVDHDRPVAVLQVGNTVMAAGHDLIVALEASAASPQVVAAIERLRQEVVAGVEQAAAVRARAETPPPPLAAEPIVRVAEPVPGLARLLAAHDAACEFYQNCYTSRVGGAARDYLASRGLGWAGQAGQPWRLGYAPGPRDGQWNALYRHLRASFTDDELLTAGLARAKSGRLIDAFLGRIMFPIRDHRLAGHPVVGFTARVLPAGEEAPIGGKYQKYLNTAETPIFKKGELLYGLTEQTAGPGPGVGSITEGPTDVLAIAGLRRTHAAFPFIGHATLGTAVTETHAAAISGNTSLGPRLILAFDGDAAGRKAHRSAFDQLAPQWEPSRDGAHIDALVLPDNLDPASAGAARLLTMLRGPLPRADRVIVDRSIDQVLARYPDRQDLHARTLAARAATTFIAARPPGEWARLAAHVAARLDLLPEIMPTLLAERANRPALDLDQPLLERTGNVHRNASRSAARPRDQPAATTARPPAHQTDSSAAPRPAAPARLHLVAGGERD